MVQELFPQLSLTLSIRDVYEELVELINSFKNADIIKASLVAQMVKRLPAMQETQVQSLGQEDPLEKEMATHSSTLAWKIPWTERLLRAW